MRIGTGGGAASIVAALLAVGCTGGKESTAAEEQIPQKNGIAQPQQQAAAGATAPAAPSLDPRKDLEAIGSAIPVYAGARYRDDLTRRDEVMIHNQYGPEA